MTIKKIALAAVLAVTSLTAAAATHVTNNIGLLGAADIGFSAGLSDPSGTAVNHALSGGFTDTFTFSYSGSAIVDVWLNTQVSLGKLATQQIVFTSATLNGTALSIDPDFTLGNTRFSTAALYQTPATGSFTLVVNGFAGLLGSENQVISASYSGGLNAMPTAAVPEPETYALLLAGLGVVGLVARRRRQR